MLLGFPLDYWNIASIQSAIGAFGRVLAWEDDQNHLTRLMVRARVLDLDKVPQFIIVTDAEGFHGNSWTVQCEVVEQQLLGGLPADEEPVPDNVGDDVNPVFDFFCFGQIAQAPAFLDNAEGNVGDDLIWGLWPEEQPNQGANPVQPIEDLNAEDNGSDVSSEDSVHLPDLNEPNIILEDVQEQQEPQGVPQPENQIILALPAELPLGPIADQVHMEVDNENINFLHEEIGPEHLIPEHELVEADQQEDVHMELAVPAPENALPVIPVEQQMEDMNQVQFNDNIFIGFMQHAAQPDPVFQEWTESRSSCGPKRHLTCTAVGPSIFNRQAHHK